MSEPTDDLSTVSWVHEELRRSIEAAHKALRRYLKEADASAGADVDAVDPAILRAARVHLHQGIGALELVGLPPVALVLRASEAVVQRAQGKAKVLTPAVVGDIERASFAALDFVARTLAGKPVSPLSLFPQLRAVHEAAEANRVHPADLWPVEWRWAAIAADPHAKPTQVSPAVHDALEAQLLPLMRGIRAEAAAKRIGDICAGVGAGASEPEVATLCRLAAGMFEAQAQGLLGFDLYTKRVASRLLPQFRILERGETDVSERLARDLLFFCAQSAPPAPGQAPRLSAARQAYAVENETPVDYSASVLGKFDPALLAHARKRVASAKEAWSGVAGGELHRLPGLMEQFALVADSLKRLFPLGEVFGAELQQAVAQTQQSNAAPPAALAMEVATSLLYIDAALQDSDFDDPAHAARVQRLADRLHGVREDHPPEPLEAWMEDLYRRVSDRQTIGSVVQELRVSLAEAEKAIDQFFRDPTAPDVLIPVSHHLTAMRGVLSVLGMEHASAALLRMRDEVDHLGTAQRDGEHAAPADRFDRIAGNLSALGFLIDMLSVQPQMAKSLFRFDAATGMLSPVMGRATDAEAAAHDPASPGSIDQRLIEQAQLLAFGAVREDVSLDDLKRDLDRLLHEAQAADQPKLGTAVTQAQAAFARAADAEALSAARGDLSEALVDYVATATDPKAATAPEPEPEERTRVAPVDDLNDFDDDAEMREVFLEEAHEVIGDAVAARVELARDATDIGVLTTLRRAFHTLKGSSRMVGLKAFGEAAWTCEQLYNTHLAEQRTAEPAFVEFTGWALDYLKGWVEEIGAREAVTHDADTVEERAQRVSAQLPPAGSEPSDIALPLVAAPNASNAFALDFGDLAGFPAADARAPIASIASTDAAASNDDALAFELDLSALDDAPVRAAEPADLTLSIDPSAPAAAPSAVDPTSAFDPFATQALEQPAFDPFATQALERPAFDPFATEVFERPAVAPQDDPALLEAFDLDLDLGDVATPDRPDVGGTPGAAEALGATGRPGVADAADASDLELDLADAGLPEVSEFDRLADALDAGEDAAAQPPAAPRLGDDDLIKVIGPLRIAIPLFNIYLNEADELSRRLTAELGEWSMEQHRPVGDTSIALAHSLAGSSATVGFADLSHLARALEHAQMRSQAAGHGTVDEARLFLDAADEIRRLLHQFAAGFLREPAPEILERLAEHEISSARRLEAISAADELPPTDDEAELEAAALAAKRSAQRTRDAHAEGVVDDDPRVDDRAADDPDRVETMPAGLPVASLDLSNASLDASIERFELEGDVDDESGAADAPRSAFGSLPQPHFDPLGIAELKPLAALVPEAPKPPTFHDSGFDAVDDIDADDAVDAELFSIFDEEACELMPRLDAHLRDWAREPGDGGHAAATMRALHTLKGGARLAGAMRLGEMAHRLETRIERILAHPPTRGADVEALQSRSDAMVHTLEALRRGGDATAAEANGSEPNLSSRAANGHDAAAPTSAPIASAGSGSPGPSLDDAVDLSQPERSNAPPSTRGPSPGTPVRTAAPRLASPAPGAEGPAIDWTRFSKPAAERVKVAERGVGAAHAAVRVGAPLLDRLVNLAGEVSVTRSRVEVGVGQIKSSLADLTDNLERLRGQLRDIEIQGETQMSSRLEAAKAAAQTFDPLEFDRFTRFQELTRMMAESVNDVATVQRTLQRSLETTEDELVAQSRMTRELQSDLLRTRMVEFEGISDRLYRVVRQAGKETGKQVRLDIVGGSIEIDRGVLDRMTGAFEHLLRNCVTHGIEAPAVRTAAGKEATGSIVVALSHEGNEVGVDIRDDGAGLDLDRIRRKGLEMGLIMEEQAHDDLELANLIFVPGFSTAASVTELAGRGVGMDVVRSDVLAMGGRIETSTEAGKGTSFKLILPLTTAVTQVVMLRCGATTVAVPSTLVETVKRVSPEEVEQAYWTGGFTLGDKPLQFFWLGSLLQIGARPIDEVGRTRSVVIVRSAQQRIAVHVDEVVGNQEVVVKNLGPQLSRLPGLAGMTLLTSGAVALIYNPVALATLYGEGARAATNAALNAAAGGAVVAPSEAEAPSAPLVLVVDDSLTVRRVTQRLLVREGFRVALAKDGLDALERLSEEMPSIVLSDIEMPRMDGFDLVRNIRSDARLRELPVIMITSRIAQKHRDHAADLGVDHYLGKPYSEEDLLALIGRYTSHPTRA